VRGAAVEIHPPVDTCVAHLLLEGRALIRRDQRVF
jgi:hypothetical protein